MSEFNPQRYGFTEDEWAKLSPETQLRLTGTSWVTEICRHDGCSRVVQTIEGGKPLCMEHGVTPLTKKEKRWWQR